MQCYISPPRHSGLIMLHLPIIMNHPNSIVASTVVNYIQASQNNYINKHYRYHCHLVEGVLLEAKSPKKELSSSSYKSTGATSEEKRGMEQRVRSNCGCIVRWVSATPPRPNTHHFTSLFEPPHTFVMHHLHSSL